MIRDNTRFGYYCSMALHLTVVAAAVVAVVVKTIFKEAPKEPIDPFEMVELPENVPVHNEPDVLPEIQTQTEMVKIENIELPPEQPVEEIQEPEPTPEPPKEAKPEPTPKPKKVEKPKPQKKISYAEFLKQNPNLKNNNKKVRRKSQAVPKIGTIRANTSNISNIANISVKTGTSTAMRNILNAYINEIKRKAKSNWAIPAAPQNVGLRTTVRFYVDRNGVISQLRIVNSSGISELDDSVVAAIKSISLPPPPDNDAHTVTIEFVVE